MVSSCSSTFYLVRHAEKAKEPAANPPLTELGQQRAEDLKNRLLSKNIKAIYSTQTLRTTNTAKPLAENLGLDIQVYDAKKQADFVENLKKIKGKNTLIVGHSNTIRHLVNGLFEKDSIKSDLQDNEYNRLFIVKRGVFKPKLKIENYGN
jgi:2,3-bisphosphoglycerate-dependent phosphoglycerate mutase